MSKSNEKIVEKIVETMAVCEKHTIHNPYDKKNSTEHFTADVEVFGQAYVGTGKNKKEATSNLKDILQKELDSGNVVVSDTWLDDNIKTKS